MCTVVTAVAWPGRCEAVLSVNAPDQELGSREVAQVVEPVLRTGSTPCFVGQSHEAVRLEIHVGVVTTSSRLFEPIVEQDPIVVSPGERGPSVGTGPRRLAASRFPATPHAVRLFRCGDFVAKAGGAVRQKDLQGAVAQWSEQGTHNPWVVGSIPTSPTDRVFG